ncbi:aconitase X swivel domain-containing protein [Chloroflexota bacterium]
MKKIIIKGKKILGGFTTGKALVSHEPISWVGEIDETNGKVRSKGHELEGMSVAGKILVYPESKGSSVAGVILKTLAYLKCAPKAIVMGKQPDHTTIQGIIVGDIPTVYLPGKNPQDLIETGDFIEVNATAGVITIKKK